MINSKSEIRNSISCRTLDVRHKQIQISKFKCHKNYFKIWLSGLKNGLGFKRVIARLAFLPLCLLLTSYCQRPEVEEPEIHEFIIMSVCSLPGYAKNLDLMGDYAYVADGQGGLQIVDINNPDSTFIVGSYITQNDANGVAIRDTFAYLAITSSTSGGLVIVSIADPSLPVFIGQDASIYCYNVAAPEDDTMYVYLAARYWFHVEDIYTWPQYPSYARRFSSPGGDFRGIYMVDTMAYLVCEQMGLYVYNLSKPDSLALVGWVDTPSNARNLVVLGNYAYIADGRAGLVIIDVSDSENPLVIGQYDTPDYANNVFVLDDCAYVADGEAGLQVIDVSNPGEPEYYGSIETSYAYDIYVRDDYIYVADRDMGLVIIMEEEE